MLPYNAPPDGVYLDTGRVELWVRGVRVSRLTPLEFQFLRVLWERDGMLVTREEIAATLWPGGGTAAERNSSIDNLASSLRGKIELDPGKPVHFQTEKGLGYRLIARPERPSRLGVLWRFAAPARSYLWPVPAALGTRSMAISRARYAYRLGSRIQLELELDRWGYLLLLDEGSEGLVHCLCPSRFVPEPRVRPGRSWLPYASPPYDAFVVGGPLGRELLLAVITRDPLELDWMPTDQPVEARVLSDDDIVEVNRRVAALPADRRLVLTTHFDVQA